MADGHIYFLLDYDRPIGSNSAYYFLCIYPFQVYSYMYANLLQLLIIITIIALPSLICMLVLNKPCGI